MEPTARWHWDEWTWTAQYGVAVLATLALTSILGQLRVFQEATLGPNAPTAADLVRLLGYAAALGLIFATALRAAAQIRPRDAVSRLLHEGLPPFATLLILPGIYGLIRPFLNDRAATGVSWIFVLLLLATAAWVGRVLYDNTEALVIGAAAIRHRVSKAIERRNASLDRPPADRPAGERPAGERPAAREPVGGNDRITAVSETERSSMESRRSA